MIRNKWLEDALEEADVAYFRSLLFKPLKFPAKFKGKFQEAAANTNSRSRIYPFDALEQSVRGLYDRTDQSDKKLAQEEAELG